MGSIDDPPFSAVIREALEYKEESAKDPNGVEFLDHIWPEIEAAEKALTPVFRTATLRFPRMPIGAWWRKRHASAFGERWGSELRFDLPDEVCRLIQSEYATNVYRKFFGATRPIQLPEVIRKPEDRDEQREPRFFGSGETLYIQPDDWETLRAALALTRDDPNGQIGGQSLQVCSFQNSTHPSIIRGRVRGATLELFLPAGVVRRITRGWEDGFRSALHAHETDKRIF